MRILFLSASGQLGGAERSLIEMITSLRRAEPGWAIGVVVSEDGPLVHRARELGAEVQVAAFPDTLARLGDSGLGSAHAAARFLPGMARAAFSLGPYCGKLREAMRAFAPDVIHSNGFKMHVLGLRCRPDDTPLIWHIHDYVSPRRLMKMLTRRLASSCALAVANSDSVAQDVRAVYGNAISVRRVYNAIDTQRFSPQGGRLDLDGLAGLPEAAPGVIRVGLPATFARWKGHSVFLQAIARLAADSPVRAYVIGGGVYRTAGSQFTLEELRAEASRLGVSDRVGFTGFVEDAAAAMRSLDIVVHASTQPEPFGMVIIEAMACGRPVVASYAGGAREIVEDGKTGLGHAPGDAAQLAQRIATLAKDGRLREEIGQAGRKKAVRSFGNARLAEELAPIYRALAGKGQILAAGVH